MILANPIVSGNTADIYLHEGKLVKLFKNFLPDTEAEYEANKQRLAYACGLPVPQIFEITKINKQQAIIMEYISGKTIGSIILENMSKAVEYMSISVDVQLRVHSIKPENYELMADTLNRKILSASILKSRSY